MKAFQSFLIFDLHYCIYLYSSYVCHYIIVSRTQRTSGFSRQSLFVHCIFFSFFRKVIRAYQDSWNHRCRLLFCCIGSSDRSRNSFADIARLLSDFFRDLDVVPSDVIAGLVLLRKFQKLEREAIIRQRKNDTYEFLSGIPITPRTQFLALNDNNVYEFFQNVIHYMHYALSAYGWPMFLITNKTGIVRLCPNLSCCAFCCGRQHSSNIDIIEDNCCNCNYAALKNMLAVGDVCTNHLHWMTLTYK